MVHTGKLHVEVFINSKEGIDFSTDSDSYIVIHDDKIIDFNINIGKTLQSKLPYDFKISHISRHCYKVILRVDNYDFHLKTDIPYLTFLLIKWAKKEFWIQKKKNMKSIIIYFLFPLLVALITIKCFHNDPNQHPNKDANKAIIKPDTVTSTSS